MTVAIEQRGEVTVLAIDRPAARNAFDDALIADLTAAFARAGSETATRAIVLTATGNVFSAGGDLAWMQRMAGASREANLADAGALARLLKTIDTCPKPTVARIPGSAFGGALGLISACDVAIAVSDAEFAASEVRIGLVPATIAPYVVRAVGVREARRLFLSGERIAADEAHRIGLVHKVTTAGDLDGAVERRLGALLAGGPAAIAATKRLLGRIAGIDDAVIEETIRALADVRATPEAKEGIAAFFAKRPPGWVK